MSPDAKIFIVGISAPSGGWKTTVAKKVVELLGDAVGIFFDDYDVDSIHPESFRTWLQNGANYHDWKTPLLADDLRKLKAGQSIISPVYYVAIEPRKCVVFDAPLGYAHPETGRYIDLMVFIDTPLDIAMARRLTRDFASIPSGSSIESTKTIQAELTAYLDYGRQAYHEMDKVKGTCDLVLDGRLSVDDLAENIVLAIKQRLVTQD